MFRGKREIRGEARVVSQFSLMLDNRVRGWGCRLRALHGPHLRGIGRLRLWRGRLQHPGFSIHLLFQLRLLRCTLLVRHLLSEIANLLVVAFGNHHSRLFPLGLGRRLSMVLREHDGQKDHDRYTGNDIGLRLLGKRAFRPNCPVSQPGLAIDLFLIGPWIFVHGRYCSLRTNSMRFLPISRYARSTTLGIT
jgi:hypothetical protein